MLERDRCLHCGGCAAACGRGAITVYETLLEVDSGRCTSCGACVRGCPTGALALDGPAPKKKRFGGR